MGSGPWPHPAVPSGLKNGLGDETGALISNERPRPMALHTRNGLLQFCNAICDSIHHRFRGFWIEEDCLPGGDVKPVRAEAKAGCKA